MLVCVKARKSIWAVTETFCKATRACLGGSTDLSVLLVCVKARKSIWAVTDPFCKTTRAHLGGSTDLSVLLVCVKARKSIWAVTEPFCKTTRAYLGGSTVACLFCQFQRWLVCSVSLYVRVFALHPGTHGLPGCVECLHPCNLPLHFSRLDDLLYYVMYHDATYPPQSFSACSLSTGKDTESVDGIVACDVSLYSVSIVFILQQLRPDVYVSSEHTRNFKHV